MQLRKSYIKLRKYYIQNDGKRRISICQWSYKYYGNYATGYADSARKTSNSNSVEEYYEKLCKKFPQISFNTNGGVVPCNSNKVVVNLSYDCLKKMANDPEFAKEIEWNLSGEVAANSQVYSFAKRDGVELGGRTVTYDANGNRQSSCGGMRTANSSNKSSDVLSTQNQQKAAKSRRTKNVSKKNT